MLHDLIDIGADLARMVHRQAVVQAEVAVLIAGVEPEPGGGPAPDVTLAFDRIARAVRRTIALARKLAEPVAASAEEEAARRRGMARQRIVREVGDAIRETAGEGEAEALNEALLERLDTENLDDDFDGRPVADIIADICRDLGVAVPEESGFGVLREAGARVDVREAGRLSLAQLARAVRSGSDPPLLAKEDASGGSLGRRNSKVQTI